MKILKTHAHPSEQANTFLVYWTNSSIRLAGMLRVKVPASLKDKPIAAELAAIKHLLEVKEALGNNLSGNAGTNLVVSSGAIRKLQRQQSDKAHLAPYANFLCTRFAACQVSVDKNSRWFTDQVPVTIEDLIVSGPQREKLRLNGLGDVLVTRHVLDRFVDRVLSDQPTEVTLQAAWKKLCKLAEHKSVREVTRKSLWAASNHNLNGKQEGRYFLNSAMNMVMVVTDNPNEGLRLVTTYPATRHFQPMVKVA